VLLAQDMKITAGCEQTSLSCFRDDVQPSIQEVQRHCSASETLLSAVLGSNILFPTTNHPRFGLGPPFVWAWNWPPLADSIRRDLNLRPFEITFSSRLPCKQYGCEPHECLKVTRVCENNCDVLGAELCHSTFDFEGCDVSIDPFDNERCCRIAADFVETCVLRYSCESR
jgi:hypothetical protein